MLSPVALSAPATLIRGALVIDGTGAEGFVSDVFLESGRVAAVGGDASTIGRQADLIVDGAGLVLTPGFIDAHSHADASPFLTGSDVSKISQGVTSEVIGNCGFSLAPAPEKFRLSIQELTGRLFPPLAFGWETVSEFLAETDRLGHATNTVPLVGHHAVRNAVMGLTDDPVTAETIRSMRAELAAALDAGVFGLSSGLIYPPGMFADQDELVQLASALPTDRTYCSHLRNEGRRLIEAVDEAIEVAELAGCRLQISHLKAAGRSAWGQVPRALDRMDAARDRGMTVHHDVYPYEANSTMLASCLPPWFHEAGAEQTMRLLRDPIALDRAERDLGRDDGTWENWVAGSGSENVLIASTATHSDYEGLNLADAARRRGTSPFETLVDLLLENELKATMSVFAMHEDDVRAAIAHPFAMIGSDGLPLGTGGKPHPRLYGTFTRVINRYVNEQQLLTLPEAVARMTSVPAAAFNIPNRGVLRAGAAADAVLFEAEQVRDRATFADPELLSTGIETVFVNGHIAFTDSAATNRRAGQRLSPTTS